MTDTSIEPVSTARLVVSPEQIARSSVCPPQYAGKPDDIAVVMLMGQGFGWDPFESLRNIQVINGMPSIKTEAQLGLVRAAGHSVSFETLDDPLGCRAVGKRADTGDTLTTTFTVKDAERAGLLKRGSGTWNSYPEVMCRWRAVGALCRALFSDVISGVLSPDEAVEVGRATNPPSAPLPPPNPLITEGKKRLLSLCDGDRDEARRIWGAWCDEHGDPTDRDAIDAICSMAIPEAEVVAEEPAADPPAELAVDAETTDDEPAEPDLFEADAEKAAVA